VEHLRRGGAAVGDQAHADLLLLPLHKLLVTPLVLAEALLVVVWLADGEKVRSQPADRVLGHLREEEGGEGAQGEEAEVPVQLDQDPGSPRARDRLCSTKVPSHISFRPAAEELDEDDDGDGAGAPDEDCLHDGNGLLAVRVLQVLIVAEEASVEGVKGVGEHVDVGHGQNEDKKSENLEGPFRHDIPAVGRAIIVMCHLGAGLAHPEHLKQSRH